MSVRSSPSCGLGAVWRRPRDLADLGLPERPETWRLWPSPSKIAQDSPSWDWPPVRQATQHNAHQKHIGAGTHWHIGVSKHRQCHPEEADGGTWRAGAFLTERNVTSPIPRNQSVWSVLQERSQGTSHPNMESVNAHIAEAWDTLVEAFIASACRSF